MGYVDLPLDGHTLNGQNHYTETFPADQTPPVNGFWSLTLYNEHHIFVPNAIKRYPVGTKNKVLKYNPDGSLTIYVQANPPAEALAATSHSMFVPTGLKPLLLTDRGRHRRCRRQIEPSPLFALCCCWAMSAIWSLIG